MQSPPLVSAVILNFRAGLKTVECVQALRRQTIISNMEILIIDNHSDDDSIGILRSHLKGIEGIRVLETANNLGFGRGYDAGIRQARGKYILMNNPDKKLQPEAVAMMVEKMESDAAIGILAPKLMHEDTSVRLSARAFPPPARCRDQTNVFAGRIPGSHAPLSGTRSLARSGTRNGLGGGGMPLDAR